MLGAPQFDRTRHAFFDVVPEDRHLNTFQRGLNGCEYEGQFAFVNGTMTEDWVMAHNIIAVHEKDAKYALKTFRIRQGSMQIDATVYDECADSDCDGCCTRNSSETGFLIDIEKYTMQRFGSGDGVVDWACLDCP